MAGWDPKANYGVGTKVSVPDYSGSFSGGNGLGSTGFGGSSGSWQDKWGGGGVDWSKSIPKYDGSAYGQKAFGDSSIDWNSIVDKSYGDDRDKLFNQLFGKAKKTDKWKQAAVGGGDGPTSDFSIMPGIGAQSGKLGDNLSFVQPASPSSMVIPGSGGMGGAIGSLIGGIGGALIGGPAGFSIGSSLGGGVGSLFG